MLGRAFRPLYRVYASVVAPLVIFVVFCPFIVLAPTLPLRREIGRLGVRVALLLIGVPLRVRGSERLPKGPSVVVANHASYLDGLVLTAALPRRFTFLVQHGAAEWPYVGLVIKRMGVRFINRTSAREGAAQTRAVIRDLQDGRSLAIFAEGTFNAEPGLLPFQKGAFTVACKAGVPVVPAVIRGTRRLLTDGDYLLRWSPVDIEILGALPMPADSDAAVTLRDDARAAILARCGEPDAAAA